MTRCSHCIGGCRGVQYELTLLAKGWSLANDARMLILHGLPAIRPSKNYWTKTSELHREWPMRLDVQSSSHVRYPGKCAKQPFSHALEVASSIVVIHLPFDYLLRQLALPLTSFLSVLQLKSVLVHRKPHSLHAVSSRS